MPAFLQFSFRKKKVYIPAVFCTTGGFALPDAAHERGTPCRADFPASDDPTTRVHQCDRMWYCRAETVERSKFGKMIYCNLFFLI